MSLVIAQSDYFWVDLQREVDWYRDRAGSEIATEYVDAVEATLHQLAKAPGIGRLRFRDWPELAGMRSSRVQRPYQRHLVFIGSTKRGFLLNALSTARATCLGGSSSRLTERRIEPKQPAFS